MSIRSYIDKIKVFGTYLRLGLKWLLVWISSLGWSVVLSWIFVTVLEDPTIIGYLNI